MNDVRFNTQGMGEMAIDALINRFTCTDALEELGAVDTSIAWDGVWISICYHDSHQQREATL